MRILVTNLSSVYNNSLKCHKILELGVNITVEWHRGTAVAKFHY
jgi:hypothetical protein